MTGWLWAYAAAALLLIILALSSIWMSVKYEIDKRRTYKEARKYDTMLKDGARQEFMVQPDVYALRRLKEAYEIRRKVMSRAILITGAVFFVTKVMTGNLWLF